MELVKGKFVFTEEELCLIKKMYLEDKLGCKEIGEYFGCSRGIIEKRLNEIGVKKRQNNCIGFTEDDIKEMKRLYIEERLSFLKISKLYNCSRTAVQNTLKKNGVQPRDDKNKGSKATCNESFFETIDSEEKAYWLGFIFGDGWIEINKKHSSDLLGLTLSIDDIEHIYKFQKSIESNHKIGNYYYGKGGFIEDKMYSRLLIKSDKLVKDLRSYGLIPNKTNKNFSPVNIPCEFIWHFIRGFFEADGSITLLSTKNGYTVGTLTFTKNPELLRFVEEQSGFKWTWRQRKSDNPMCKTISISKKEFTIPFLDLMYGNATIYLDRKYQRYLEIKKTQTINMSKDRV